MVIGMMSFFYILGSSSTENKNHQWFGVSLLSGGKDKFVAVSNLCYQCLEIDLHQQMMQINVSMKVTYYM